MHSFDIYFLGESLPGADPVAVRRGVAKLFKVQEASVDRLFSGNPLRVKQAVDADAASRYRAAFREAGALIQVVPSGSPPPAARPQPPRLPITDSVVDVQTQETPSPKLTTSPAAAGDGVDAKTGEQARDGSFDLAEPGRSSTTARHHQQHRSTPAAFRPCRQTPGRWRTAGTRNRTARYRTSAICDWSTTEPHPGDRSAIGQCQML